MLAALSSVLERLGKILEPMTTEPEPEPEPEPHLDEALLSLLSVHIQWQVGLGQFEAVGHRKRNPQRAPGSVDVKKLTASAAVVSRAWDGSGRSPRKT